MEWSPLVTAASAILVAAITALGTIYVARSRTKTDISTSIASGFQELTNQLQEERKDLSEIIERQREVIDKHRVTIEALYNEGQELREDGRRLRRRIDQLEEAMLKAGVALPSTLIIVA